METDRQAGDRQTDRQETDRSLGFFGWPPTSLWFLCFHCCFVLHVEMVQWELFCSGVILQGLQVCGEEEQFSAVCWPMGAVRGAEMSSRAENPPVFTVCPLKCHQTHSRTFSRCSSSNLSCHFTSSHSLLTWSPDISRSPAPTFSTSPAHIPAHSQSLPAPQTLASLDEFTCFICSPAFWTFWVKLNFFISCLSFRNTELHFTRLTHELCEVVHKFLTVKSIHLQIWWFWIFKRKKKQNWRNPSFLQQL